MFCPRMNSEGFQKCITFTLPSVSMSNTTSHHISRRLPKDLHTLHLSPRSSSPINNQWTEVLNLPNPILSLLPLPITLIYQTPPAYQYKHHFQTLPHYTKHFHTTPNTSPQRCLITTPPASTTPTTREKTSTSITPEASQCKEEQQYAAHCARHALSRSLPRT
jgi:hypothetical protein